MLKSYSSYLSNSSDNALGKPQGEKVKWKAEHMQR